MLYNLFFLASISILANAQSWQQAIGPPDQWVSNIEAQLMPYAQDLSYYALVGAGAMILVKAFTGK
jgi:hypothetical protein